MTAKDQKAVVAEYLPHDNDQWRLGVRIEIYRGESMAEARNAAADKLGYRDHAGLIEWAGEDERGIESIWLARRDFREGHRCVQIHADEKARV